MVGQRLRPAPDARRRPATRPSRGAPAAAADPLSILPRFERIWCFAAPFSVTGQPAISLPIGQTAAGCRSASSSSRRSDERISAARGGTARDGCAVERSPSAAVLRRFRARSARTALDTHQTQVTGNRPTPDAAGVGRAPGVRSLSRRNHVAQRILGAVSQAHCPRQSGSRRPGG